MHPEEEDFNHHATTMITALPPPPAVPNPWLTYGDVKRMIESCIGSDGEYTLSLWTTGKEPLLPKHYFPGRKRASYSRRRVEELLQPLQNSVPHL